MLRSRRIITTAALCVASMLGSAGAALAQKHEIPAAPADYLEKKSTVDASAKDVIGRGSKLYDRRCAKCHGPKGDGQGKSAADLNPPVPSFLDGYLKGRKDGQLLWIIAKGSPKTDMDAFGPGTSYNMSEDDIWSVIAFMRSKFGK